MVRPKQNIAIDIAKFIASILVVGIHVPVILSAGALSHIVSFVESLAVPIFFAISSYLFFRKNTELSISILLHFIKRIGLLYAIWFLLCLIVMPQHNDIIWSWKAITQILMGHTFPGSWFYSAIIVSTVIVYFISKINRLLAFVVSCIVYFYFVCIHEGLFSSFIYSWYEDNIDQCFLSFPYAMIFTGIGALLAHYLDNYKYSTLIYCNLFFIALFSSTFFLFENWQEVVSWVIRFFLVEAICIGCCSFKFTNSFDSSSLRKLSTLIFMIHFYFVYSIEMDFVWCGINVKFFVVLFLSLLLSMAIIRLQKYIQFLKYLY